MWIVAGYYPETYGGTYDDTGSDNGYEWTPDYDGGWYLWKNWVYPRRKEGGWDCVEESRELRWSDWGGPFLLDPYEPTDFPDPIPEPPVTFALAIYVNGTSMPVVESMIDLTKKIIGIDASLIIGPI